MKSNSYLRSLSFLLSLFFIVIFLPGCVNGGINAESNNIPVDNNGINQILDIDKLDEVIALSEVKYNSLNYTYYNSGTEYFGFDEALDDKLTYKLMYKSDDYEVAGYISAPSDYMKQKYPILVFLRGGKGTYGILPAVVSQLSNFGFIVMSTQYRGNDGGTGKEDYAGADVQDVLSMIDIAQQLPFANGKIYICGESRGGLQTYCTLKEEHLADRDRITAAVVISGVTDLEELYNFRDWDMKITLKLLVGDTPEELPEEYEKRSAVYWPEMINVPLLIIHGRSDIRVPVEQAENIYGLLRSSNMDVELRLYDAGHSDLPPESFSDALEWLHGTIKD